MKKLLFLTILVCCRASTLADTLTVGPGGYDSIQAAIDDANNGDTIVVTAGTYLENIDFLGKAVTLRSADPNDPCVVASTIIDGSAPNDPNIASAVTFVNGEGPDSVLTGFTIINGTGQSDPCGASWSSKGTCGGGVFCRGASPTITKNLFRNCSAGYGGGAIYCHDQASPTITENSFEHNYAGWYGGAIFARLKCSPEISNNRIVSNSAGYLAGAVYLADQSYSRVTGNWIEGNSSISQNGGAIYFFVDSDPVIANNVIIANTAKYTGGAIMASAGTGKIINNTIIGNRLSSPLDAGAALAIFSNQSLANNIVADNQGWGIYTGDESNATLHNNNFWNNSYGDYAGKLPDQTGINGNISADPEFAPDLPEPFEGVYELHPNSPCIDTGSNSDVPAWLVADYDRTPRVLRGLVDIGAQEFDAIGVPQDYPTIQQAIEAAEPNDQIIVTPGFYQENLDFLGKNLTLRSVNPFDPCCVADTIIDGNEASNCIIIHSGEDKRTTIAGFTIQNGYANLEDRWYGGGIFVADDCGATIIYNRILNNRADRYGGGIDTRHYSDTVIEHNTITNNYCGNMGAGIHVGANATVRIAHNYIADNETAYARQGGGIYIYNWSDVEIVDNEICRNWSSSGGGIYAWKGVGLIARNHIWGNYATHIGGAIGLHPSEGEPFSIMTVVNNVIEGNVTGPGGRGGGVFLSQGNSIVVNNTIVGNTADANSGAGVAFEAGAYADLRNNIIANNTGGFGIHVKYYSYLPVDPDITSNDLWNNQAGNYGGVNHGGGPVDRTGLDGNISADPCFVATGRWSDNNTPSDPNDDYWICGDYHILPFSACRDAGTEPNVPEDDFEGDARPAFAAFDIGADEMADDDFYWLALLRQLWLSQEPNSVLDLYDDDFIDLRDFARLARYWSGPD